MLSGENQTDGNSLERFLTPYQCSRLPLIFSCLTLLATEELGIWGHEKALECDDEELALSCQADYSIKVHRAFYGRREEGTKHFHCCFIFVGHTIY